MSFTDQSPMFWCIGSSYCIIFCWLLYCVVSLFMPSSRYEKNYKANAHFHRLRGPWWGFVKKDVVKWSHCKAKSWQCETIAIIFLILNSFLPTYQEALIKAGCSHNLKYQKQDHKKDDKSCGLTPPPPPPPPSLSPYSKNVTAKVGVFFLSVIT